MTSERSPGVRLALFAAAAALMVLTSVGLSAALGADDGAERVITIPLGTAERLAAGEDVALIPPTLQIRLRDRIVVVNHDVSRHQVGPFTVEPGERVERRFSEAATISVVCSLHPSGRITLDIGGA